MLVHRLMLVLTIATGAAAAQEPNAVVKTVETFLTQRTAGVPGKVSIEVGAVALRESHTACQEWEAFMPGMNERIWGVVSVGVRCTKGSSAALYVPARVHVMGRYLVAARRLSADQPLGRGDMKYVNGDLSVLPPDILTAEEQLTGLSTRTFVQAEQPLRAALFRPEMAVSAGQPVKLVARGTSFSVVAEGVALSSAAVGQNVRVKTATGTVTTATVTDKGIAETR